MCIILVLIKDCLYISIKKCDVSTTLMFLFHILRLLTFGLHINEKAQFSLSGQDLVPYLLPFFCFQDALGGASPCQFRYSLLVTLSGPWRNLFVMSSDLFVGGWERLSSYLCAGIGSSKNVSLLFKISIFLLKQENTTWIFIGFCWSAYCEFKFSIWVSVFIFLLV